MRMWVLFAFGSALFAGLTAVLAKIGVRDVDSNLATALRTVVVLAFSWLMVLIAGAWQPLSSIEGRALLFLALSGLATGASWLCYFRALQLGEVNRVSAVDKSSTVLTMLLALILLGEGLTPAKIAAMALIAVGTGLMLQTGRPHDSAASGADRQKTSAPGRAKAASLKTSGRWFLYALGSAVFASLTTILGKVGIEGVNSTLGTALRTAVVLVMAWGMVFLTGAQRGIGKISRRTWLFLLLSGIATGASWLCYYHALREGPASAVAPIDKLSILVTAAFSRLWLGEKLSARSLGGLGLLTAGTLMTLL